MSAKRIDFILQNLRFASVSFSVLGNKIQDARPPEDDKDGYPFSVLLQCLTQLTAINILFMTSVEFTEQYKSLYQTIFNLYHQPENQSKLLFHGWHHVQFVHNKAIEFAVELNCDIEKVAVGALVHDLNYIFSDHLEPEVVNRQIIEYLTNAGYKKDFVNDILRIIEDGHIAYRNKRKLSKEAMALSDADTLFKAIPTTPILFTSKYITQNKYDIAKLAHKIIEEQRPLLNSGKYFYTDIAKRKYLKWAKNNLEMWENVLESLNDNDVKEMLKVASDLEVL